MAKETPANYSTAQEALIRDFAASVSGPLNFDHAKTLAANPDMNDNDGQPRKPRSIVAKIVRMGVAYKAKENTTKDGGEIIRKEQLVERIAAVVGGNLEGLNKAAKPTLVKLAEFVERTGTEG